MALGVDTQIKNILKTYYKDGVQNLLMRNSPLLQKLSTTRVEGKEASFAAVYGAGGAVGASFTKAKAIAEGGTVKNAEFKVTPGQLFSVMSMNAQEVQASLTKKGAYMKACGNKFFASTEALRRVMAAAVYSDGYGIIHTFTPAESGSIATTGTELTLPSDAVIKLDTDAYVTFLAATDGHNADSTNTTAKVTKIDGNKVTFQATGTAITLTASTAYVIRLYGACTTNNTPNLPMGLAGWLPAASVSGGESFFGVDRSINRDRLAGHFIDDSSNSSATIKSTVQKAIQAVRSNGSKADLIVLNDNDFAVLANAVESTNTFFTKTSEKGKKSATIGFSELNAAFSTSWIENVIDDPYCPKGIGYILEQDNVELWSYTNADWKDNGITDNNPGKADAEAFADNDVANNPSQLIIDDYINVQPGSGGDDGPNVLATLQFFGSVVVLNPANCAVMKFYEA